MNIEVVKKELIRLKNETENKYWNIGTDTAKYLQNLILKNNYNSVLEIGTSNGLSALYIVEALIKNNGKLTTIESHPTRYKEAKNNFEKAGINNYVRIIKDHSPEVLKSITETFDLIFIDCVKSTYLETYICSKNKLNKNGIIICDNALSHKDELNEFMNYLVKEKDIKYEILNIENGLLTIYIQ